MRKLNQVKRRVKKEQRKNHEGIIEMNKIVITIMMLVGLAVDGLAQRYHSYFPAQEMYMFGVSFSAVDSTVYFTDIKQVPDTYVEKGTGFLYSRNQYSGQLQQYVRSTTSAQFTSVVCYNKKRKSLEKKFSKMRQKYQKRNFVVKYVSGDFAFTSVPYVDVEASEAPAPVEESKPKPPMGRPNGPRPAGSPAGGPGGRGGH